MAYKKWLVYDVKVQVHASKGQVLHSAPVHQWTHSSLTSRLCRYVPNWTWWMAAMGCRWKAVKIWWCAPQQIMYWAAACFYIYRDFNPLPPLFSHSLLLIGVSACAAASPSLLETRRELMVMSQLPPTKTLLPGTWLFVQDSSAFCKATGDPWPLNPFSSGPPGLDPNSYILMSCVLPCLPQDTLPDKDTCMLQLLLYFLRVLCGR